MLLDLHSGKAWQDQLVSASGSVSWRRFKAEARVLRKLRHGARGACWEDGGSGGADRGPRVLGCFYLRVLSPHPLLLQHWGFRAANLPGAPGAQDGETERKPGSSAVYVLASKPHHDISNCILLIKASLLPRGKELFVLL